MFRQGLKGKFYSVVVRPTLLYGSQCCPVKNMHVQNMDEDAQIDVWAY